MTLAMPVSSSIEMKMKPFAVPGRWRAMTQPAARTNSPSRQRRSSAAERTFLRLQFLPSIVHGMFADREAGSGIIGDQTLLSIHLLQRQSIGIFAQPFAILPQQRPFQFSGALHLPESIAAMLDSVELDSGHRSAPAASVLSIEQGNAQRKIFR